MPGDHSNDSRSNQMQPIYLDHNSTTPIHPDVAQAISEAYQAGFVNPASQHRQGQQARKVLEQFRISIGDMLGAQTTGMLTDQLVFTSGGTESNNLALQGIAVAKQEENPDQVISVAISAIEHPSLVGAGEQLARMGFDVIKIPVDQNGICRPSEIDSLIHECTIKGRPLRIVSVMLANNETGIVQPIREIADLCHSRDVIVHCDAVQAVGKIPVHFRDLHVDAMSFTAHKFSGPRGIGGLIVKAGIQLNPILFGGFQQLSLRPGTEDVALVVGLGTALKMFCQDSGPMRTVEKLRDQLESFLGEQIPAAVIIGQDEKRVPQTLNVAFTGIDRQAFLMAADIANLAISTGSACASGSSDPSPVLMAMRLPESVISSAIRISLGVSTTEAEINEACQRILNIYNNLRPKK